MLLVNTPVTGVIGSLVVWPSAIVGVCEVDDQQTPHFVFASPPLSVNVPPEVAVVCVMFVVGLTVVTTGRVKVANTCVGP